MPCVCVHPCYVCVCACVCVYVRHLSDVSLSRSALSRLLQAILPVGQLTFSTETEQNSAGVSMVPELQRTCMCVCVCVCVFCLSVLY